MSILKKLNIMYIFGIILIALAIYTNNRIFLTGDFLYRIDDLFNQNTTTIFLSLGVMSITVEFILKKHYLTIYNFIQKSTNKLIDYIDYHSEEFKEYKYEYLIGLTQLVVILIAFIDNTIYIYISGLIFLIFIIKILALNLHKSLLVVLLPFITILLLEYYDGFNVTTTVVLIFIVVGIILTTIIFYIVRMTLSQTVFDIKLYSFCIVYLLLTVFLSFLFLMNSFVQDTNFIRDAFLISIPPIIMIFIQMKYKMKELKITN